MKNSFWGKLTSLFKPPRGALPGRLWRDYQWFLIGGLWLVALSLGYAGFARQAAMHNEPSTRLDWFYLTLQLIPLNSGAVPGPVSWELQVARLLLPALTALAALKALATIFGEQVQMIRLGFMGDHVIICGLGRMGVLLVDQFRARGEKVVVIEHDQDNDYIDLCREQGAIVLNGDATDSDLLRRARTQKAKCLIAVLGDDGSNAEVAVRAHEMSIERKGSALTAFIHIVDPQLWELLRGREISLESDMPFRLEMFNIFERGARLMLQAYPPWKESGADRARLVHLLIIGIGRMGESLVLQAAKEWQQRRGASDESLRITLVDQEAMLRAESLKVRYPQLTRTCDLLPLEIEVHSPEFHRAEFLYDQGRGEVDSVYICLDDDALGLDTGLRLSHQMRNHPIPIVVRMAEEAGLARLLLAEHADKKAFRNLHAFGLLNKTCTADLLLGGTHEMLARALHDEYRSHQLEQGQTPDANPALVPWDRLSETVKESNRRQADHVGLKLKAIGCEIGPLRDWEAPNFEFTPQEIELMASLEHERWLQDKRAAGWRHARGERDEARKIHPSLVAWEALPDSEKEKNRITVREQPRLLARAGLEIYRYG